ncbi:MAG: cation transporter [Bacilli bacterium]|nr:cation transporter [Bacilli bacterium]
MEEKIRNKKIIQTSFIGILGNVALVAAKAFIGILTGSSSIISDAINNLSDALSSTVTIVGTKLSAKRPNKKHPFGYGRIEYLTATVVAALILFAGCSAVYESITSLVRGEKPSYDWVAFLIISIGIAAKLALGLFFRIRGKKLDSGAVKNSGTDALFDAALSAGTLIAALISHFANVYLEGYVGIFIGLFIIRSGFLAMRDSLSPILGDRIDDQLASEIKAQICAHPGVKGAYDLVVNNYGEGRSIGSIHIEVDDELTAREIFALEREIQAYMYQEHKILMTVGIYASNESDPLAKEIKTKLFNLVHQDKEILQCHGFYYDDERELVSFDLIIDFDAKRKQEDIAQDIVSALEKDYPKLRFIANLDQDFAA